MPVPMGKPNRHLPHSPYECLFVRWNNLHSIAVATQQLAFDMVNFLRRDLNVFD
jgi:hypothetical protein